MLNRNEARKEINERPLTDFINLTPSPNAGQNMYNCPICGSGTGKHGTGALKIYPENNRVICHSGNCFSDKGEDTIGALRIIWQCSEAEAIRKAGYSFTDGTQTEAPRKERSEPARKPSADYTLFYREANEALKKSPEALDYLHKRGITDASIERFNLGYCASWKHSTSPNSTPTRRIIVPRNKETYLARSIDKPRNEWEENHQKLTEGRQKDLFNLAALQGAETLFICEGELDAISLYQAGASSVIGICPVNNTGVMLEEAKKHPETVYILALDNDPDKENGSNPGKDAQRKLAAGMEAAGLQYLNYDPAKIYGEAKDANEAFTKDRGRLEKVIAELQAEAQEMKAAKDEEREAELRKRTGEGMLESFLLKVTDAEKKEFEPIKTGIKSLDRALEGGFTRKTLVMLGAAPGMGKTAFAQWIFENMASAGNDVLYINLEMAREQLLARSISRIAWKNNAFDVSALQVLRGYSWTDTERGEILKAAEAYKSEIAPHFIYNPDNVTNRIDSILAAMEAEAARIKAQGKPAPLVCIDYLQLIDSGERDATEGMKSTIAKLKEYARKYETVVFVIMANNRESNKSGTANLESGRDTSAIEYSGDLIIGLAYSAIEEKRTYKTEGKNGVQRMAEYDIETLRRLRRDALKNGKDVPPVCNEYTLKVLKNRFGVPDSQVNLVFDGKHATFNIREDRFTDSEEFTI